MPTKKGHSCQQRPGQRQGQVGHSTLAKGEGEDEDGATAAARPPRILLSWHSRLLALASHNLGRSVVPWCELSGQVATPPWRKTVPGSRVRLPGPVTQALCPPGCTALYIITSSLHLNSVSGVGFFRVTTSLIAERHNHSELPTVVHTAVTTMPCRQDVAKKRTGLDSNLALQASSPPWPAKVGLSSLHLTTQ